MIENQELKLIKANILVVDDNPVNLRLLVQILTAKGYKVRPVPNGKLAVSTSQAAPPDLILLDINMPNMDGYEVCQKLKDDPQTADVPVIFISAYNNAIDKVKAFEVGGVDYIPKPFQVEEVLVRVKNHLSIRILQKTLQEKNTNLQQTLEELKTTQEQLIQSEKMAALGQLIAGIAHEINTPLGAIRSSIGNIKDFFEKNLIKMPIFFRNLTAKETEVYFKLLKLSSQKNQILSSREIRNLRRNLVAKLEAKNVPDCYSIADVLVDLGLDQKIEQITPFLKNERGLKIFEQIYQFYTLRQSATTINIATEKAAKIVFALKTHARYDSGEIPRKSDIINGIETVLTLYQNQFKPGVNVIKNYGKIPKIYCYPDSLNQVWTNLIHNALQAMDYKGKLIIDVSQEKSYLQVKITDTGKGIPQEIMPKIFKPFFTTKPPGEGSGLGLDIVNKIINKHQASIDVDSVPGKTTFTVAIPINLEENISNV
ncbi:MAG: response regulator [Xenococcaceae cyanobacterium MO_167.B52]|nr:response regulator [Xenococcaceae cyanobacterium MO_167.B52]